MVYTYNISKYFIRNQIDAWTSTLEGQGNTGVTLPDSDKSVDLENNVHLRPTQVHTTVSPETIITTDSTFVELPTKLNELPKDVEITSMASAKTENNAEINVPDFTASTKISIGNDPLEITTIESIFKSSQASMNEFETSITGQPLIPFQMFHLLPEDSLDSEEEIRKTIKDNIISILTDIVAKKSSIFKMPTILNVLVKQESPFKDPSIETSCCSTSQNGEPSIIYFDISLPSEFGTTKSFEIPLQKRGNTNNLPVTIPNGEQLYDALETELQKINLQNVVDLPDPNDNNDNAVSNESYIFPFEASVIIEIIPDQQQDAIKRQIENNIAEEFKKIYMANIPMDVENKNIHIHVLQGPKFIDPTLNISCCSGGKGQENDGIVITVSLPSSVETEDAFPIPIKEIRKMDDDSTTLKFDNIKLKNILNIQLRSLDLSKVIPPSDKQDTSNLSDSQIYNDVKIIEEPFLDANQLKDNIKKTIHKSITNIIENGTIGDLKISTIDVEVIQHQNIDEPKVQTSCCAKNDLDNSSKITVDIFLPSGITSKQDFEIPIDNVLNPEDDKEFSIDDQLLDVILDRELVSVSVFDVKIPTRKDFESTSEDNTNIEATSSISFDTFEPSSLNTENTVVSSTKVDVDTVPNDLLELTTTVPKISDINSGEKESLPVSTDIDDGDLGIENILSTSTHLKTTTLSSDESSDRNTIGDSSTSQTVFPSQHTVSIVDLTSDSVNQEGTEEMLDGSGQIPTDPKTTLDPTLETKAPVPTIPVASNGGNTDTLSSTASRDIDNDDESTVTQSSIFVSELTSVGIVEEGSGEVADSSSEIPSTSIMAPSIQLPTVDSNIVTSTDDDYDVVNDEKIPGQFGGTTHSSQSSNNNPVSNGVAKSTPETISVNILDVSTTSSKIPTFNQTTDKILPKQTETHGGIDAENILSTSTQSTSLGSSKPQQEDQLETNEVLDISYYNSTAKTSFRLAVCLEGINCETDSEPCFLVHQKCNEVFNVSVIPFKVRKKLSECTVDDTICHLENNPVLQCENSFIQCTKIVVPTKYLSTLKLVKLEEDESVDPNADVFPTSENKTNIDSDIDLFLQLLGESIQNKPPENISDTNNVGLSNINSLTSSILEAIGETFPGGIDITDLNDLDGPIDALFDDNETLPISNEIIFLIDENQPGNALIPNFDQNRNETNFNIDFTNVTTIFNPESVHAETNNKLLKELLRKAIINKIKDQVHICNASTCAGNADQKTHSNLQNSPQTVLQNTNVTSSDIQVLLAICLTGIECKEEQVCLIAQENCIGKKAFKLFDKRTRIAISECQVNHYLCVLAKNKNCVPTKKKCVSNIEEKLKHIAHTSTYENVIEKVADGITSMTSNDITEGTIYVELKNNASDRTQDTSEMILVSKPVNNEPRIMLTAITPDIQFDLEGKDKLQIKIDTTDINEIEIQQQKNITKQRIKDALRKIIIYNSDVRKSPNSVEDTPTGDKDQGSVGVKIPFTHPSTDITANSPSNTKEKLKFKGANKQVEEVIIDGIKQIINQTLGNDINVDVVTIRIEQSTSTSVPEVITSCCSKNTDNSEVRSEVYVKVPGNVDSTHIFNVPGNKIIPAVNVSSEQPFNEEKLRVVLKKPLDVLNESISLPSTENSPNVDTDLDTSIQISVSTPIVPAHSENAVKQKIKEGIIDGVSNIIKANEDVLSGLNSVKVEVNQSPEIVTPNVELFCCNKSLPDQPNSIIVNVMLPSQLENHSSINIPLDINSTLKDDLDTLNDDTFDKSLDSLVNGIDLDGTDLIVSDEVVEGSGFESSLPSSGKNATLPKIRVSSVIPVNTLPSNEDFRQKLQATLVEVAQNVVGNDNTASGAEEVNIHISQNTNNLHPSIEVSCCDEEGPGHPIIANIDVKLPSRKNATETFKVPITKTNKKSGTSKNKWITSHTLEDTIRKKLGLIDFKSNIGTIETKKNNDSSLPQTTSIPQEVSYEAIIPIQLERSRNITKQKIVDKIVSNIQNIIQYSPEGHVNTLNVQTETDLENEELSVNISCCNIPQSANETSVAVVIKVPSKVNNSNAIKIIIPKTSDPNNQKSKLNTTALQQLLVDSLDTFNIEKDLSSPVPIVGAKPVLGKNPTKPAKIHFKIPLQPLNRKGETKQHIKNNIIEGVKYAISNGRKGQSSKESLRINAVKGPNINLPIVQTSCCSKDTDDNTRIIDVKIRLKSKSNDTLNINIPLDNYVISSENQETELNEELFSNVLEQHLDNVIDKIEFQSPNEPDFSVDPAIQQSVKPVNDTTDGIHSPKPEISDGSEIQENKDQEKHSSINNGTKFNMVIPEFHLTVTDESEVSSQTEVKQNKPDVSTKAANGHSSEEHNVGNDRISTRPSGTSHDFQSFPPFKFNISVNTNKEPILAGPIPNNINGKPPEIIQNLATLRPSILQSGQPQLQTDSQTTDGTVGTGISSEFDTTPTTLPEPIQTQTADTEKPETPGLLSRIRDVIIALATALMVQNIGLPLGVGGPARKGDTNIGGDIFPNRPIFGFNGIGGGGRPFIVKDPKVRKTLEESNAFFDGTSLNFTIPVQVGQTIIT